MTWFDQKTQGDIIKSDEWNNMTNFILKDKVIGIEYNITQDTWQTIDENGDPINLNPSDFNKLWTWAGITRYNIAPDGSINAEYGDDNYAEDGSNGRVMTGIPRFYVRSEVVTESGDLKIRRFISGIKRSGFKVYPGYNQRTDDPPAEMLYVGTYEAGFKSDAGTYKLLSEAGRQPWTGGTIWKVGFDSGSIEPSIGDELSTTSEAGWIIADYDVNSGDWGTGDATGFLYLRKKGDDTQGWADNEQIDNVTTGDTDIATTDTASAQTSLHFDIEEARTYAENVGTNWGLMNIWTLGAIQLLFNIEYGNMDSQTELGRGIVDLAGGTGFDGKLTGADNINTNLDTALTGTGDQADGVTPITYRGIENPWGNTWTFIEGYEAVDSEYRILDRDGNWSSPGPASWTSSDYETSETSPLTDTNGYISNIENEELLRFLNIASEVAGSSSEYIPDYFYSHDSGENNILRSGGLWNSGSRAGVSYLASTSGVGPSRRFNGARLEFVK